MIISFDFDGTLFDEFGGSNNPQKDEIQGLAIKYLKEGHEVIIITKRYGPECSNSGIINEHLIVYDVAKRIGINRVYFTNRDMKFSHIIQLKVDMHFENSDYEIDLISEACKENNHNCKLIPVEDPYWRDLVY